MLNNKTNKGGFFERVKRAARIGTAVAVLGLGGLEGIIGCGGSSGSSGGGDESTPVPTEPAQPTPYNFNYEQKANLAPFYTQEAKAISDPLVGYGQNSVESSCKYAMSAAEFVNAYENDANFNALFNGVYRPIMKMLNPNLTDVEADAQVENLVKSLTNNQETDLDTQMNQDVFFGYVPDGSGGQKAYFAMAAVDEQDNPFVAAVINDGKMVMNGTTPISNVKPLVDFIMTDVNYGGM